jgi:hypothetical protein
MFDALSPVAKSVNEVAQNAAKSMSARVTEKTNSGAIQFQKFQRFFRGQWPRRLPRTTG